MHPVDKTEEKTTSPGSALTLIQDPKQSKTKNKVGLFSSF